MIRPAAPEDSAAVIDLVIAAEMFSNDDAGFLEGMLADYFDGNKDEGHVCVIDDEGGPLGVAYYQPEPAADRVWDLTMIAVRPAHQGRGRGAAMLRSRPPYPVVRQAGREHLIATSAPTATWGPPR